MVLLLASGVVGLILWLALENRVCLVGTREKEVSDDVRFVVGGSWWNEQGLKKEELGKTDAISKSSGQMEKAHGKGEYPSMRQTWLLSAGLLIYK